jgi:hypothetical protein
MMQVIDVSPKIRFTFIDTYSDEEVYRKDFSFGDMALYSREGEESGLNLSGIIQELVSENKDQIEMTLKCTNVNIIKEEYSYDRNSLFMIVPYSYSVEKDRVFSELFVSASLVVGMFSFSLNWEV